MGVSGSCTLKNKARAQMKKLYVILGILAILVSVLSVRGAVLDASPREESACCETVQYTIEISNDLSVQRFFKLTATPDSEDIKVILQPDSIMIPANSKQDLVMLVRPACGMPAGDYTIRITSELQDNCPETCGELCPYASGEAEVKLIVPEGCEPPEKPHELPDVTITADNTTQGETPTGAVVTANGDDYTAIGALFLLLGVLMILLALIKRD
jgi:hypothetical protein